MTTDFAQDELGSMLRDSMARYAEEQYDFSVRDQLLADGKGYAPQVWADAAEQGWLAVRHPEAMDGAAGDVATVGALMELVGRHLLMEPWLVSAGLGAGLIAASDDEDLKAQWLPAMAAGEHTVSVAWRTSVASALSLEQGRVRGDVVGLLHGNIANAVLVPVRDSDGALSIVSVGLDQAEIKRSDRPLIDGRRVADIVFDGASCQRLLFNDSEQAWQRMRAEALALLCAEGAGVANRLLEQTLEYVRVRKQFGQPIGRNQALQHRLVEMRLQVEESQAMAAA
ncbi:MAG: acyl-CoA dehydrogenase family protein, partial [Algiphilus sp.]